MHKTHSTILVSLLAIIVFAWAYLVYQHWQMTSLPMSEMWMPPAEAVAWKHADFALVYLMWAAMMAAMMLPSAIPMIFAFSHVARRCYQAPQKYSFLFIYGYLLAWLVFSIGMTLLQWQLHGLQVISSMMETKSELLSAMIFLAAGIYQLTPLKSRFLRYCRSPAGFLLNEWQEGAKGAFQMGLKHGSTRLSCCWAQISWGKDCAIKSHLICRAGGVLFLGWGLWLL